MSLRSAAAVLAAGALLAGCSSGPATNAPTTGNATTAAATRWWSATDYCGILRETTQAGHSILPGVSARDPKLLAATKSFVASVTAAAPDKVRAQWQVLGPALVQLVQSGGKSGEMSGVNTRLVAQAATAIAADAKSRCHLDVSS